MDTWRSTTCNLSTVKQFLILVKGAKCIDLQWDLTTLSLSIFLRKTALQRGERRLQYLILNKRNSILPLGFFLS